MRNAPSNRLLAIVASAAIVLALALGPAIAHHGRITSREIKNRGVKGRDIASSAVGSRAIRTGAVRDSELANGSVDGGELEDGTVSGVDIKDGSVESQDLASGLLEGTLRITPQEMDSWQATSTSCGGTETGSQSFANGTAQTPPLGTGSREFNTGTDGASYEQFRNTTLDGTKLADLTALRYSTAVEAPHGSTEQAPYLILNIDKDNDGDEDNLLFFEPIYQDDNFPVNGAPDQDNVKDDTWQTWNARIGKWAVGDQSVGNPGAAGLSTLDDYIATNASAVVQKFRVVVGCGGAEWADFTGYVDAVELGTSEVSVIYDFERA